MAVLDTLLPREARNGDPGGAIPFYALCAVTAVMTARSLIHLLKDDSGVHSIATILAFPGDPDPDRVIHLYSALWGSQQLVTAMFYVVVLVRYRNLVPLVWLLFGIEVVLRGVAGSLHPLGEEFYQRTPPGMRGNLPMLALASLMLFLCLRDPRRAATRAA